MMEKVCEMGSIHFELFTLCSQNSLGFFIFSTYKAKNCVFSLCHDNFFADLESHVTNGDKM